MCYIWNDVEVFKMISLNELPFSWFCFFPSAFAITPINVVHLSIHCSCCWHIIVLMVVGASTKCSFFCLKWCVALCSLVAWLFQVSSVGKSQLWVNLSLDFSCLLSWFVIEICFWDVAHWICVKDFLFLVRLFFILQFLYYFIFSFRLYNECLFWLFFFYIIFLF